MNFCQLHGAFSFARSPDSPSLAAGVQGLALSAGTPRIEDGTVHLPLSLFYRVPEPVRGSYRDLVRAIVLVADGAAFEQLAAVQLVDPAQPQYDYAPNYRGEAHGWGNPECSCEGFVNLALRLALSRHTQRATLHLHAAFSTITSNMVIVELDLSPPDDREETAP